MIFADRMTWSPSWFLLYSQVTILLRLNWVRLLCLIPLDLTRKTAMVPTCRWRGQNWVLQTKLRGLTHLNKHRQTNRLYLFTKCNKLRSVYSGAASHWTSNPIEQYNANDMIRQFDVNFLFDRKSKMILKDCCSEFQSQMKQTNFMWHVLWEGDFWIHFRKIWCQNRHFLNKLKAFSWLILKLYAKKCLVVMWRFRSSTVVNFISIEMICWFW